MGRTRPGQGDPARVLRPARPRAQRARSPTSSADAADWIAEVVAERCPDAVRCADAVPRGGLGHRGPRRGPPRRPGTTPARWPAPNRNAAAGGRRPTRRPDRATSGPAALKHARYALWKNPENLTERQTDKLAWIAKTDPRLHRAYLLKEGLRHVFTVKGRSRQARPGPVAVLGPPLPHPRLRRTSASGSANTAPRIDATLDHDLSNALIESTNTKIRLLTRIAFGFRSPDALIALAMLTLGGHRPALPGRPHDPQIGQESRLFGGCSGGRNGPLIRYAVTASDTPRRWVPGTIEQSRHDGP